MSKGPLTIPANAHPIVRGCFSEMIARGVSHAEMQAEAGIGIGTVTRWSTRNTPQLQTIEAALNVLGFELAIVPRGSRDAMGFLQQPKG